MALSLPDIRQLLKAMIPFVGRTGLEVLEARPGFSSCRMPLEGNGNHLGTMYAGAIFTLTEIAGGVLAIATFDGKEFYPVVKSVDVAFKAPLTTDATVTVQLDDNAIGRIIDDALRTNRGEFVLEAEIRDAKGNTVATSRSAYQIRKKTNPLAITTPGH